MTLIYFPSLPPSQSTTECTVHHNCSGSSVLRDGKVSGTQAMASCHTARRLLVQEGT